MIIYCDGSSTNRDGPSSRASFSIKVDNDPVVTYDCLGTSNEAEYKGLLRALDAALLSNEPVTIRLDSELVHRQMLGMYQVRCGRLRELNALAHHTLDACTSVGTPVILERIGSEDNLAHTGLSDPNVFNGVEDIDNTRNRSSRLVNTNLRNEEEPC